MKYIIAFFLLFISFNTYSDRWAPPYCPDANMTLDQCSCPPRTERDGNLCIYPDPPYVPPEIEQICSSGYDPYPARGGDVNCFAPCPPLHKRVYDSDGFAVKSCSADCPTDGDYSLNIEKGFCHVFCVEPKEAVGGWCRPMCFAPEYRDPLTKQCVLPKEPEPPKPPKNCNNNIAIAIQCLQINVSNLIAQTSSQNIQEKQETNELLKQISENIGKLNNSNGNGNNNGNNNSSSSEALDLSDLDKFNADTPFYETDPSNLSSNIFRSNASCPKDSSINLYGKTFSFKYSALCTELNFVGNFILILSMVLGVMIVIRR